MPLAFKISMIVIVLLAGSLMLYEETKQPRLSEAITEAWQRIPLPPKPELIGSFRDDTKERTLSNTKLKRELYGTMTVSEAVSDPTSECHTAFTDPYECYANYLTYITEQSGIEDAFVAIKSLYNNGDTYAISQCHQLTHIIGRAAASKFPIIAEAYNYGDTFCWSGYFHGVMEAIIADIGLENIPDRLNDICEDLPGRDTYSFNYYNCVHGLGHGTMYVSGHELFDALELCDLLEGFWEKESCYGGVYMENVIANDIDHVSNYLKPDDLLYPCNAVDHQYKSQCYLMQTSYMLRESGGDFKAVFDLCGTVESPHKNTCYQSLGRDASGQTLSNIEATKDICLGSQNEAAIENCLEGAVKDFISYFHNDSEAKELCTSLPLAKRDKCLRTVEVYYSTF